MDTGNLIKRIRLSLGLTKAEMSEKIGITDKTYRKYENSGVSIEKFMELARRVGIKIDASRTFRIEVPNSDPIVIQEQITVEERVPDEDDNQE